MALPVNHDGPYEESWCSILRLPMAHPEATQGPPKDSQTQKLLMAHLDTLRLLIANLGLCVWPMAYPELSDGPTLKTPAGPPRDS